MTAVYRTEAEALTGERLPLVSLYFMREWAPLLGTFATDLFLQLRIEALAGQSDGRPEDARSARANSRRMASKTARPIRKALETLSRLWLGSHACPARLRGLAGPGTSSSAHDTRC